MTMMGAQAAQHLKDLGHRMSPPYSSKTVSNVQSGLVVL